MAVQLERRRKTLEDTMEVQTYWLRDAMRRSRDSLHHLHLALIAGNSAGLSIMLAKLDIPKAATGNVESVAALATLMPSVVIYFLGALTASLVFITRWLRYEDLARDCEARLTACGVELSNLHNGVAAAVTRQRATRYRVAGWVEPHLLWLSTFAFFAAPAVLLFPLMDLLDLAI